MKTSPPLRSWLEMVLGCLSAIVVAATLVWPDWIERLFDAEPDGGDGSAEWGWAIALATISLVLFADAGRIWWRAARSQSTGK